MNVSYSLRSIVTLMLLSAAGIIGMLLADGAWDWVFLALASLPVLLGGYGAWRHRASASNKL